ncbi:MAG: L-threonylcarbamoyladenylate synthase [Hyphomicrobiaceae bacterium]|nr:L-threonylcarbamoyladenylate synthase [Hyphomicrobiaceae bacterium]
MRSLADTPDSVEIAAAALRAGRLVAFPTETVYGLGADATNATAVAAIFAAKGRPRFNPLIVHLADVAGGRAHVTWEDRAERLAAAFWPGPLTLVLPRRTPSAIADLVSAGLPSLAIRVPAHPLARALIKAAGVPLAAPSANLSGRVSPTTAAHVAGDLAGTVDIVLDGGPCGIGLESTVLDLTTSRPVILRPGGITAEAIGAILGEPVAHLDTPPAPHGLSTGSMAEALPSPGLLASHYAPTAPVRLGATRTEPGEALLTFGAPITGHSGPRFDLSPSGDLVEAATRLFAGLRALDLPGVMAIAVMPVPGEGLGEAINDRLLRAAAPRPAAHAGTGKAD